MNKRDRVLMIQKLSDELKFHYTIIGSSGTKLQLGYMFLNGYYLTKGGVLKINRNTTWIKLI